MNQQNTSKKFPERGCLKILHVDIPEAIYWHIRECAIESRMSMKAFVTELGRTASPINIRNTDSIQENGNESDQSNDKRAA